MPVIKTECVAEVRRFYDDILGFRIVTDEDGMAMPASTKSSICANSSACRRINSVASSRLIVGDVDLVRAFHHRHHLDPGKTGLTTTLVIERGDPHEPVSVLLHRQRASELVTRRSRQ